MTNYRGFLAATIIVALLAPLAAGAQDDDGDGNVATGINLSSDSDSGTQGGNPWVGIAPRVGLDIPTSALNPFVVAALEIDVFLPVLDKKLVVALDSSFTFPRTDGSAVASNGVRYDYTNKVLELKFALDVIYRFFGHDHKLVPFAGVGFALQYLKTMQETTPDLGANDVTSTKPGFEILGGLDYRLGIGYIFGDVRFVFTKLDNNLTGDTNAGNLTLCAGYRFVLP